MRSFDLTPLFRTSVGFDRLNQLLDASRAFDEAPAYPPYNIEKIDDETYRISMAVAGFGDDEIEVTAHDQLLTIAGKHEDYAEDGKYLHRGIATRAFERRFQLADHIKVTGAELVNGLLHVDLAREVPEALRPRKIEVRGAAKPKVLENSKAA